MPVPHGHDAGIQMFYRQKYKKLESRPALTAQLGEKRVWWVPERFPVLDFGNLRSRLGMVSVPQYRGDDSAHGPRPSCCFLPGETHHNPPRTGGSQAVRIA